MGLQGFRVSQNISSATRHRYSASEKSEVEYRHNHQKENQSTGLVSFPVNIETEKKQKPCAHTRRSTGERTGLS